MTASHEDNFFDYDLFYFFNLQILCIVFVSYISAPYSV